MIKKLILLSVCVFIIYVGACSNKGEQMSQPNITLDFDTLWNFFEPAETRAKFEKLLLDSFKKGDKSYHLQLVTQLARTYGLEGNYAKAHELLDQVEEEMEDNFKIAQLRYLLERGRTYRSSKEVEKSIPLFQAGYDLAIKLGEDFYAIDAAHMMAVASKGFENRMKWSQLALQKTEESKVERAQKWKGSLYNNIGWDYHDNQQFDKALKMFEKAQMYCEERGEQKRINIAKWSVARCLRSLEEYEKSLEIQLALLQEYDKTGETDGYVFEELGELYLLKNNIEESEKYFALAYEYLSKDTWMMENEKDRMERIKNLGKVK